MKEILRIVLTFFVTIIWIPFIVVGLVGLALFVVFIIVPLEALFGPE